MAAELVGLMDAERAVAMAAVSAAIEAAGRVDSRGCLRADSKDSETAGLWA